MLQLPQRPDLKLARPPLAEVIFQVRFPPILRIISQQPMEFQERVRDRFPLYEAEEGVVVHFGTVTVEPPLQPQTRIFRFKSADEKTTISLATDFYAVSTTAYKHWSDFLSMISLANAAARDVYDLKFSSRIGLRYVNRLTLANTGVKTVRGLWRLLRPEITSLVRQPLWGAPKEMLSQLTAENMDGEFLTSRFVYRDGTEPHLILDFDYYSEARTPMESITSHIERYHDTIYAAFRWCLSEKSILAFGPITP